MSTRFNVQRSGQQRLVIWQPYSESLHVTLTRTGAIGLAVGCTVAYLQRQPAAWPHWTAFALWFSFGGHWVELFFLNWLRPRLASARWTQVAVRLLVWLVGGTLLMLGARTMASSLDVPSMRLPPWWLGGPGFVGIELLVHTLLLFRGHPNFYDGRS